MMERTAIFIDGSNFYATLKTLNIKVDYIKFLDYFKKKYSLVRALYYTAIPSGEEYNPIKPLVDFLDYNGFCVVTKMIKEFTDPVTGAKKFKGNIDIDLAVGMLELAENIDHVILVSGDGDFTSALEAVQRKGVKVTVLSTISSNKPMLSDDLRRQADDFIDIVDIRQFIEDPMLDKEPEDEKEE